MKSFLMQVSTLILISSIFSSFVYNEKSGESKRADYPKSTDGLDLPDQLHVVGTIREINYGISGYFCIGGYVKVELDKADPHYLSKSVYLITACLSNDVKTNMRVDVHATLHTGKETECYYQSFAKPKEEKDIIFYKLSENETRKLATIRKTSE